MAESVDREPLPGLSRTSLMNAALAQAKTFDRVEAHRIRMPAGTAAGLHVHNCPVVGNIVEGSVACQVEGDPVSVLVPGDVFFEPERTRIARFDALDHDVTFLAYYLLSPGQTPQINFPTK